MKIRPFLLGVLIGVAIAALSAVAAIHGNNLRWERAAYDHFAGVYTFDAKAKHVKLKWMWLDQYYKENLLPRAKEMRHTTPTPSPAWRTL